MAGALALVTKEAVPFARRRPEVRTYDWSVAGTFTFRMRAYAAAHFEWDDVLIVT